MLIRPDPSAYLINTESEWSSSIIYSILFILALCGEREREREREVPKKKWRMRMPHQVGCSGGFLWRRRPILTSIIITSGNTRSLLLLLLTQIVFVILQLQFMMFVCCCSWERSVTKGFERTEPACFGNWGCHLLLIIIIMIRLRLVFFFFLDDAYVLI